MPAEADWQAVHSDSMKSETSYSGKRQSSVTAQLAVHIAGQPGTIRFLREK